VSGMFRRQRKARVLFGLSDIVLLTLAFEIAYRLRSAMHLRFEFYITLHQQVLLLGFSLVASVLIGLWLQIYERLDAGHPRVILRDTTRQCGYAALCLLVFEYALRMELSRFLLAAYPALAWIFLVLFRLLAGRMVGLIRREFAEPHDVMVVGTSARAIRIAQSVEQAAPYGVRLRGFLSEAGSAPPEITLSEPYPVYPVADLPAILRKQVVDELIFAVDSQSLAELESVFLLCDEEGVRTGVAVDFFPHVNSTVALESLGATPLLTFSAAPSDEVRLLIKRLIDVVISAAALVVLAPFMAVIAALIRLTSPGPAIFKQVRCGFNGRQFVFYKFRSMCQDAEAMKAAVAHLSVRETALKIPDDPRQTRLGRYLRKFSIDEWPQLWNVLRGDMSLVGPRTAVPGEVDQYKRWQRRRLRMRPGLTCLWAISGRDNLDFDTWMKLDLQYIDNWSLGLDFRILLLTVPHVLTGHGVT
jgi:exopolysaccharide biosynthesis polyprenyl glycosylphosphotransferase